MRKFMKPLPLVWTENEAKKMTSPNSHRMHANGFTIKTNLLAENWRRKQQIKICFKNIYSSDNVDFSFERYAKFSVHTVYDLRR